MSELKITNYELRMSDALENLNRAATETAAADFLNCCGSRRWAQEMTAARPFADADELFLRAGQIWRSLDAPDLLEAFAAHPKIGARKIDEKHSPRFAEWSRAEQSGASAANVSLLDDLAEANRLYERKFGFIFIVCATGKSAEEMLEICRRRLANDADAEIRVAASEQAKITEIRLKKLLDSEI